MSQESNGGKKKPNRTKNFRYFFWLPEVSLHYTCKTHEMLYTVYSNALIMHDLGWIIITQKWAMPSKNPDFNFSSSVCTYFEEGREYNEYKQKWHLSQWCYHCHFMSAAYTLRKRLRTLVSVSTQTEILAG